MFEREPTIFIALEFTDEMLVRENHGRGTIITKLVYSETPIDDDVAIREIEHALSHGFRLQPLVRFGYPTMGADALFVRELIKLWNIVPPTPYSNHTAVPLKIGDVVIVVQVEQWPPEIDESLAPEERATLLEVEADRRLRNRMVRCTRIVIQSFETCPMQ